jgi:hypothetical protein
VRNARADVISGLSPGKSGSATPRYRGQHRCGAIDDADVSDAIDAPFDDISSD